MNADENRRLTILVAVAAVLPDAGWFLGAFLLTVRAPAWVLVT